ncbi:hypothetical protein A2U01_0011086, partial [Trifolium medium]|nr:hypothetical protein [Trifolium medium]
MKSLLWIYLWTMFVASNQAFKVVSFCVWFHVPVNQRRAASGGFVAK